MRILKASAAALVLSLALGVGGASAGDWHKHHWVSKDHWLGNFVHAFFMEVKKAKM
jgi:hypothetical protein